MWIGCSTSNLITIITVEPTKNGAKKIKSTTKNKPHELDSQGMVPLPAKTCFYCRKSCKKAPLVACDYCPLFFHQVSGFTQTEMAIYYRGDWIQLTSRFVSFFKKGLSRSSTNRIADRIMDVSESSRTIYRKCMYWCLFFLLKLKSVPSTLCRIGSSYRPYPLLKE